MEKCQAWEKRKFSREKDVHDSFDMNPRGGQIFDTSGDQMWKHLFRSENSRQTITSLATPFFLGILALIYSFS